MFIKKTKLAVMTAAVALVVSAPVAVKAATTNIDAVAVFLDAITIAGTADMDFGVIEFAAAPGAGDTVSLGTDGNLAYAGTFSGAGTGGVAGQVDVTAGTDTNTIEVFCDTTATMTDGTESINVISIEAVAEGSEGAFGAGSACNGVAGAAATTMVLDIGGGTADHFSFGGQIDGSTASGGFGAGSFSTANAGGDDIQVDVFYQ